MIKINKMNSAYALRGLLIVPPVLFILLCKWNEIEDEYIVWLIGGITFGIGLIIRIWSQMHLHYRLKIKKTLTTSRPYAYVRNPIYIGNILLFVGTACMSELLWFAPIVLVYSVIVYTFVIRYEESFLAEKYGAPYTEYLAHTPM